MYRVIKTLNHNAILATGVEDNQEYILLGKGIGFGRKVSERVEAPEDARVYSLQNVTERGKAKELLQDTPTEYLEIANQILDEAEKEKSRKIKKNERLSTNHSSANMMRTSGSDAIIW